MIRTEPQKPVASDAKKAHKITICDGSADTADCELDNNAGRANGAGKQTAAVDRPLPFGATERVRPSRALPL